MVDIGRRCGLRSAAACALAVTVPAWAQSGYPTKTIRFIAPYAPGGAGDSVARMIAERLQEAWGQQVIVENRTGAGGQIGNDHVAKSAPDGYTVLIAITQLIQSPALYKKQPYQLSDLAPVAQITAGPVLLAVHHSLPVNTFQEFVAMVKAKPGTYSYGSFGAGTGSHIAGEIIKRQLGLDMAHVPYRGASALATDMLGGQVLIGFIDTGTVRPHLAGGKLRLLGVSGPARHKVAPGVPTFAELGVRNLEPMGWTAAFVPAATPKEIVHKLSAEIVRIVRTPEMTQRIDALGLTAAARGVEEFAPAVKQEAAVWAKAIHETQISLD